MFSRSEPGGKPYPCSCNPGEHDAPGKSEPVRALVNATRFIAIAIIPMIGSFGRVGLTIALGCRNVVTRQRVHRPEGFRLMSAPVFTLVGGPTALIEAGGFRLLTEADRTQ